MSTEWQEMAGCAGMATELFFPVSPTRMPRAVRAACRSCPVLAECRAMALSGPEIFGIWGGMTEDDRRLERRRERYAARLERVAALWHRRVQVLLLRDLPSAPDVFRLMVARS